MSRRPPRTVVVGFDALDPDYLDAFADDLPNLSRLRESGVSAPLRSTVPPWTGSAWPSMYTGTDPGTHGVFDFFRCDTYPDEAELVSRTDVDAPAIWDYLTDDGIPSVVCNVPVTHPAEPIEGVLVPGYLAPDDEPGHPEGIRDRLSAELGEEYRIYSRHEKADVNDTAKLNAYLDLIDLRRRAAETLLSSEPWRFAFLQVQKTDTVFHNLDDESAFRAVYRAADDFLGTVLETVDDGTNVVVCSDHGIGPVDGYKVFVNEILRRHGLVTETSSGSHPSLGEAKRERLLSGAGADEDAGESAAERLAAVAESALRRVGITPGRVYRGAQLVGIESTLLSAVPASVHDAVSKQPDWRGSAAYCRSKNRMGVRINLAGRDPDGTVPPSEYERVRSEVIDVLSNVHTPDGEPAFEFVEPGEAVYDGAETDRVDDVVFLPRDMNNVVSTTLYDREFVPVDRHDHKREGVFLGAGPGFDADADPGALSLTDVAPIVMALLRRPVPERMTGSVPDGLLAGPARRETYEVAFGAGTSTGERGEKRVVSRLENLGYM